MLLFGNGKITIEWNTSSRNAKIKMRMVRTNKTFNGGLIIVILHMWLTTFTVSNGILRTTIATTIQFLWRNFTKKILTLTVTYHSVAI